MKNRSMVFILIALCMALVFTACNNGSFDTAKNYRGGGNGSGAEEFDDTTPLCFTAYDKGVEVSLIKALPDNGEPIQVPIIEFSTDGENWVTYDYLDPNKPKIQLKNKGDKVYFRGDNETFNKANAGGPDTILSFSFSGNVAASGNIMSLLDKTMKSTTITVDYCFNRLFSNCKTLIRAPALPATTLSGGCYYLMFENCTSLTLAPVLPATELAPSCYWAMFNGCTGLTKAPELKATELANYCYWAMFIGCKSLKEAPELPATELEDGCYSAMFAGCESITKAPALPATTMKKQCYNSMFWQCSGLTEAPELPATKLANSCYKYMFGGCTSLTTAPELPATTLEENCYAYMFSQSTNLNSVKVHFTEWHDSINATLEWLGTVASQGILNCPSTLTVPSVRSDSNLPEGWEMQPF